MYSLETLVKDIGASSAAIMVPNTAEKYLYCFDSYNMPTEWVEIKNSFDKYSSYGNVHVYKTGNPKITNSLKIPFHGHYIESVMIVPIKQKDKVIGTLELIHSSLNKTFNKSDLQKAVDFSNKIEIKPV